MKIKIKKIKLNDLKWVRDVFVKRWGADFVVSWGKIHRPEELEGFVAEVKNKKVGLITFKTKNRELEITSLDSFLEGKGVGTSLVKKVIKLAKRKKIKRIWLITTNDNLSALRFWQKRGFRLVKVYPSVIDKITRKLKPQIPKVGAFGIPIRDEIELEMKL